MKTIQFRNPRRAPLLILLATLYGELVRESTPSGNYNCKLQKPIRIIKKEG